MEKKFLLALLLIILIGGGYAYEAIYKNSSPVQVYKALFATPTPTPIPTRMQKVTSSDGTMTLEMKIDTHIDLTKTDSFYVKDNTKKTERLLFTQTLGKNDSYSIPDNSWSPDDREVFIKRVTSNTVEYIVFKASGEMYANGQQFLQVASTFAQKELSYVFDSVTGWAAPTLLVVYTKNPNGSTWPHFWFVTDNQSLLQLVR